MVKHPFSKSTPEDFDELDEIEGVAEEEPASDEGPDSDFDPTSFDGPAAEEDEERPRSLNRTKMILIGGLMVVGIGGAVTGYFLVGGGEPDPEGEHASASGEDGPKVQGTGFIDLSKPPPEDKPLPSETAKDALVETDTSLGRRPWLQTSKDNPDAGTIPTPETGAAPATEGAPPGTPAPQLALSPPPPAPPGPTPPPAEPVLAEPVLAEPSADPAPQDTIGPDPGEEAPEPEPQVASLSGSPVESGNAGKFADPPQPVPYTGKDVPLPPMWKQLKTPEGNKPLEGLVPISTVHEQTPQGMLPIVSPDGETAAKVYARPHIDSGLKKIALVVTGLGMHTAATEAAIKGLPAAVTLAFSPYAANLDQWVAQARQSGHEVLLSLPMEPMNFPARDPGPYGLLTLLSPPENMARLEKVLGRTTGYVGVVADMGERFLTNTQHVGSILEQLRTRGLIYVDNGKGLKTVNVAPKGLVFAASELDVDERLFKESIDARLRRLITVTQEQGQVVGIAKATPLSLTRIVEWSQSLSTIGIELAPISALAKAEP